VGCIVEVLDLRLHTNSCTFCNDFHNFFPLKICPGNFINSFVTILFTVAKSPTTDPLAGMEPVAHDVAAYSSTTETLNLTRHPWWQKTKSCEPSGLLDALESMMLLYYVCNLEYPNECFNTFLFLQRQVMKVHSTQKMPTQGIGSIVRH
jgi:hypothetical protein